MGLVGLHAGRGCCWNLVQLALLLAWLLECGQIPAVVGGGGGPRSLASLFLVLCLVCCVFAGLHHDTLPRLARLGYRTQCKHKVINNGGQPIVAATRRPVGRKYSEDGDRSAVTGSRDDLRGVAREGFPTELGETLFESSSPGVLGARSIKRQHWSLKEQCLRRRNLI